MIERGEWRRMKDEGVCMCGGGKQRLGAEYNDGTTFRRCFRMNSSPISERQAIVIHRRQKALQRGQNVYVWDYACRFKICL